jgi:hypothetical protein
MTEFSGTVISTIEERLLGYFRRPVETHEDVSEVGSTDQQEPMNFKGIKNVDGLVTLISKDGSVHRDYWILSIAASPKGAADRDLFLVPWDLREEMRSNAEFIGYVYDPFGRNNVDAETLTRQGQIMNAHLNDPVVLPSLQVSCFSADGGIPEELKKQVYDSVELLLKANDRYQETHPSFEEQIEASRSTPKTHDKKLDETWDLAPKTINLTCGP